MDRSASSAPLTQHLARPGGRVAFTVQGDGPLVVVVPGMGDLRSVYRDVTPGLVGAGYRVAEVDLRGHGESDTTFTEHGDVATGQDLLALLDHLGAPGVLVGHSMAGSASLWAAAERPDLVAGLVLIGPFVRDAAQPRWQALTVRVGLSLALRRPWGASAWAALYRSFYLGKERARPRTGVRGRLPEWFGEHVADIRSTLRNPAHLRSLRELAGQLAHEVVHERLDEVRAPALVLVGALDPDYPDPAAELDYIERRLRAAVGTGPVGTGGPVGAGGSARAGGSVRAVLVPECGHYPHSQRPDVVLAEALAFLARTFGERRDA